MKKNIGTNDVVKYVNGVCKQNVKKTNKAAMIRFDMQMKVRDAEYDERVTRKAFNQKLSEYKEATIKGSHADIAFRNIMKYEVEDVWIKGKPKKRKKYSEQ